MDPWASGCELRALDTKTINRVAIKFSIDSKKITPLPHRHFPSPVTNTSSDSPLMVRWILPLFSVWSWPHRLGTLVSQRRWTFMSQPHTHTQRDTQKCLKTSLTLDFTVIKFKTFFFHAVTSSQWTQHHTQSWTKKKTKQKTSQKVTRFCCCSLCHNFMFTQKKIPL